MKNESLDTIKGLLKTKDKANIIIALTLLKYNTEIKINPNTKDKLIKSVNIIDRVNCIEDIFYEAQIDRSILPFQEPKNSLEKYLNSCIIIPIIARVANEGWIPDFTNNEYKHFPYFIKNKNGPGWSVCGGYCIDDDSGLPGGFYYKSKELAIEFAKKFIGFYEDWLNYNN